MVHATPTQVLLTTTLQPLVMPLSGLLAHAVSLLDQCLSHEPTPQAMATFERERSALLCEVGHRAGKEGAAATVSVLDRRGKRLGTVSLVTGCGFRQPLAKFKPDKQQSTQVYPSPPKE